MRNRYERATRRVDPGRLLALAMWLAWGGMAVAPARAQVPIPGLPGAPKPDAPPKKDKPIPAPTKDNPQATVAVTSGPIDVDKPVDDKAIQRTLGELLPMIPEVRSARVQVKDGVVILEGQVQDDNAQDDVTAFTGKVKGVRIVVNRMKTDAQVLTARQLAHNVLVEFWGQISRKWLLVLIALAIVLIGASLARLLGAYAEALLAPFIPNVMLRAVVGSLLSSLLILGGVLLALSVLNLTHAVLSILGVASIVGLAIGFAFRDITENFIASVLLGVRRPFRIGDYITVAGYSGVVKTLNTRATVLVTLEGNHVRIPNNVIYKEIMVNSSASTSTRGKFDVLIPYEVSTATALEAMNGALRAQEGILPDPPARALLEALESNGVRLRAYYWIPGQGVDGDQLQSEIKLRVKVALQQAGIAPPPECMLISVAGTVPVVVSQAERARPEATLRPGAVVNAEQAKANLRHDSRAADNASGAALTNGRQTALEQALNQAENHVSDEGANLLDDGKDKTPEG
jgi:small-conductance mechanosensitive channel